MKSSRSTLSRWRVEQSTASDREYNPADRWTCYAYDWESLDQYGEAAGIDGGMYPTMEDAYAAAVQGIADQQRVSV